jgi:hypothetical protein
MSSGFLFPLVSPRVAWLTLLFSGLCTQAGEPFSALSQQPRARVVIVQDDEATEAFSPRPVRVQDMMNRAIIALTGKPTVAEAWRSLVSTQDVVGLKVFSQPGANSGTRPAVVASVITGLLAAGLPSKNIIIWDKQVAHLRLAGFAELADRYKVRFAGSAQAGYDENAAYDNALLGSLVWGDSEFGKTGAGTGRKSFVSKLVTKQITRIINITPLLNHNDAGVSGNLFGLAIGGVDNTFRFELDPARLATAVPEIYGLTNLNDHVALNIVDALICQYEGGEQGLLHYSTPLNQLRLSKDPVALDVLSLKELDRQRTGASAPNSKSHLDLYENASLLELGVSDPKRIDVEKLK